MTTVYADAWLSIHGGDCREVMAAMEPESVHCVVTSPPYWGLRDYGQPGQLGLEPTPEQYVENMVAVFREVRRVLRSDGTVWLNLGDSYAGGGTSPQGLTGQMATRAVAASRAHRRRNGLTGGTRTVDVSLGGSSAPGLKPKDLVGIPWRVAFALQADGWYLRSDIIWSKPNPMPESVTDRPTKSHEYLFLLSKSARYYYDADAVREPNSNPELTEMRVDWRERPNNGEWPSGTGGRMGSVTQGRNLRSVWTIATQPYRGAHFATFPEALVEPCIKAGSPVSGIVLDPFGGSGTTARVANRLSRRAVLIDLNPDYLRQQMKRNRDIPLGLELPA